MARPVRQRRGAHDDGSGGHRRPVAGRADRSGGSYVYVVKADQTVEMRPVAVARVAGNETVIKDGVVPGDTVVTDGHLRLVPGSRISVKGAEGAKPTS